MAIATERLRRRILKSGLLSEETLGAHFASLPQDRQPNSAKELAESLIAAGRLTKFQARALVAGETKHLVLGNYVIEDEIGAGGMGRVYLARHKFMNRLVALKTIADTKAESQEVIERFRREVRVAAKLNHANIVTAYDADEANGILYLTMQYIRGESLSALVRREGSLPTTQAVDFVCQAALGLGYAHQSGIIHRDIKPSNLLLDENSTVKVLDMGLARWSDDTGSSDTYEKSQLTTTGQVLGTADFISPEQARNLGNASETSDVYSLGCTLYWLLTGVPPYPSTTLMEALLAHQLASIPSVLDVRDDISPALDAVITRMLAKEPNHRQQSMDEVIDELHNGVSPYAITVGQSSSASPELESFFEGFAPTAVAAPAEQVAPDAVTVDLHDVETVAPTGERRNPVERMSNHRVTISLIAAAAVICVLAAVLIFRNGQQPPRRSALNGAVPTLNVTRRATLIPKTDVVRSIAFSRDGRWLAAGEGSVLRLWDRKNNVGGPPLVGHADVINAVAFAPDNLSVATGGQDGSIRIWNVATGRQRPMLTDHAAVQCISYSPDGKLLAAGFDDGTAALWELPDTQIRQTLPVSDRPVSSIAFSGNGRLLVACSGDREIWVFDTQVGPSSRRPLDGHRQRVNAVGFIRGGMDTQNVMQSETLISTATDGATSEIFFWDLSQEKDIRRLERRYVIDAMAISDSGQQILVGSKESDLGNVVLIEGDDWQDTVLLGDSPSNVLDVAFAADGKQVGASLSDGSIRIWNLADHQQQAALLGSCEITRCVEYLPGSNYFVSAGDGSDSGGGGGVVKIWDARDGRELWTLPRVHNGGVQAIACMPRNGIFATADETGRIVLWNSITRTAEPKSPLEDDGPIYALSASPTQPQLVSAGGRQGEARLRIWDLLTGEPGPDIAVGHTDLVAAVCHSPDGKAIATGSHDGTVRLWNPDSDTPAEVISKHDHKVLTVAFSPDGEWLASGGRDHLIKMRNLKSGRNYNFVRHRDHVRHVRFTTDGKYLFSASNDGTICIWDVRRERFVKQMQGSDAQAIRQLAIALDQTSFVSTNGDGTIALWGIRHGNTK